MALENTVQFPEVLGFFSGHGRLLYLDIQFVWQIIALTVSDCHDAIVLPHKAIGRGRRNTGGLAQLLWLGCSFPLGKKNARMHIFLIKRRARCWFYSQKNVR